MEAELVKTYLERADAAIEYLKTSTPPPKRKGLKPEQQAALIELWKQGYTAKAIALAVGCSTASISNYRIRLGLQSRVTYTTDRKNAIPAHLAVRSTQAEHSPSPSPPSAVGDRSARAGGAQT